VARVSLADARAFFIDDGFRCGIKRPFARTGAGTITSFWDQTLSREWEGGETSHPTGVGRWCGNSARTRGTDDETGAWGDAADDRGGGSVGPSVFSTGGGRFATRRQVRGRFPAGGCGGETAPGRRLLHGASERHRSRPGGDLPFRLPVPDDRECKGSSRGGSEKPRCGGQKRGARRGDSGKGSG
jgi:hypothetical protein